MSTNVKEAAVLSVLGIATETDNLTQGEVFSNLRRVEDLLTVLEDQKKLLRLKAFEVAEKEGVADDKGSFLVKLPDGNWYKKEARTSVKLKVEDAVSLFQSRGLEERLQRDVLQIDPDILIQSLPSNILAMAPYKVTEADVEQSFYAGEITDEELQGLVERTTVYALKLKPNKK